MWKNTLAVCFCIAVVVSAAAHDGVHDDWLKTLKNGNNVSCCDGSDAYSVVEPDWEMMHGEDAVHYRVRQSTKHGWMLVADKAVITDVNKIGVAKVWPTIDASGLWTSIRCFLPGSGA
jgi:hypothetical protein